MTYSKLFIFIIWGGVLIGNQPQVLAIADGPDCWKVINVIPTDILSVRSGPGVKYPQIAELAHDADGIQVTGTAKQIDKAFWVPILYDEITGWVNQAYLGEGSDCFDELAYHIVVKGDTLFGISQRYDYSVEEIARWNSLQKPYQLQIGQRLQVSPPTMKIMKVCTIYHVVEVKSNDMLWIRAKAGTKSEKIGAIPYDGKGIQITGDEVKLKISRWVPIKYKGVKGWVNRDYLEKDC